MDDKGRKRGDRATPPGDFTSDELREQTARFLEELRRRAEKRRLKPHKKPGPPPPNSS